MSDDRKPTRADRMWAALPRVLRAHGRDGALGRLIDVLGASLDRLDRDLDAVMRDRWLALASGEAPDQGVPSPLARLGTALGVPRESWEDAERYRRRLATTAPILGGGLGTPRAVLALAAAALDGELCPRLTRRLDATTGWALAPGTVAHCPAAPCLGSGPCPRAGARLVRLDLVDNPATQNSVRFASIDIGQEFTVRSLSLETDRPEIELTAGADAIAFPVLENRSSNELVLFAGTLEPGQTWLLRPRVTAAEARVFDSVAPVYHHAWRARAALGETAIVGVAYDMQDRVYYVRGDVFDAARFAWGEDQGAHFARFEPDLRTPAVRPGEDTWRLRTFGRQDVEAFFGEDVQGPLSEVPDTPGSGRADVVLRWWTRPPAAFCLQVPRNQAVQDAEARGELGLDLLYRSVLRARGAGILADIEIVEPPEKEAHVVVERPLAMAARRAFDESVRPTDTLNMAMGRKLAEYHQVDEQVGFIGRLDTTRFDASRFAP